MLADRFNSILLPVCCRERHFSQIFCWVAKLFRVNAWGIWKMRINGLVWTKKEMKDSNIRGGWSNTDLIINKQLCRSLQWVWTRKALNTQKVSVPKDTIKKEKQRKEDSLVNKSHSSSSVSSCKSFLFHPNGTASGFIKIYELNHHWKYKTLVGARGGNERGAEGGREGEVGGETGDQVREKQQRNRWKQKDECCEIGRFWFEQMSRLYPKSFTLSFMLLLFLLQTCWHPIWKLLSNKALQKQAAVQPR